MGETVAIIQARMGSSRLPGKVLLDLGGQSMLARVLNRASRAAGLDELVVATTTDKGDDALQTYCEGVGYLCFRGDPYDVLDRYYQCARWVEAETVVRITADCPFIAPEEITRVLKVFQTTNYDFVANRLPPPFKRTSPIGMDTEVVSFANLERAWKEAKEPYEREHVMPYFYDTPGRFRVKLVQRRPSLGHLRFTVDTPEDLALAQEIYAAFGNQDDFTLEELLEANALHPEWQASVSTVKHKGFRDVDARRPGGKGEAHG
ncbi:MAG TPA: glycosyltransferase family protein [Anaerolineaceae bacterium]|nr:glycosyltransferase family protein [Anaerolineaceae bacterium]